MVNIANMSLSKRVLLVDDDSDLLEALQLMFELDGFVTRGLERGNNITSVVQEFSPDVIVLDVLLSGEDGRNICKKLKGAEQTKGIPVVMLSSYPGVEQSVAASGADCFVAKPFDLDRLLDVVTQLI